MGDKGKKDKNKNTLHKSEKVSVKQKRSDRKNKKTAMSEEPAARNGEQR